MDVILDADVKAARVAAAIGDPARARMLYALVDGFARTSTELAMAAEISPSTASAHLSRLKEENLVKVDIQGRHRYYSLAGPTVAGVLEALSVVVGSSGSRFVPNTPSELRAARTCYDHLAGSLGVALHDKFQELGWLSESYDLTPAGTKALTTLSVDIDATRALRRQFAYPCLDWSERRPHIGGALGAVILKLTIQKAWVTQDLESRAIAITDLGRREIAAHFGLELSLPV